MMWQNQFGTINRYLKVTKFNDILNLAIFAFLVFLAIFSTF